MSAIRQFLRRIRTSGVKRPKSVTTTAMGREREFNAYDIGEDTFVFEKGLSFSPNERASVLVAEKRDLKGRARGMVMTLTTGNHSVAAFPLLDGRFWRLSTLPSARRGDALLHKIVCANIVGDTIEISQREISTKKVVTVDRWLRQKAGFTLPDIVMGERNDDTLDYYRKLGQEWRVVHKKHSDLKGSGASQGFLQFCCCIVLVFWFGISLSQGLSANTLAMLKQAKVINKT